MDTREYQRLEGPQLNSAALDSTANWHMNSYLWFSRLAVTVTSGAILACGDSGRRARFSQPTVVFAPDRRGVDFLHDTLALVSAQTEVSVIAERYGKAFLYLRVRLNDGRVGYVIWGPDIEYIE